MSRVGACKQDERGVVSLLTVLFFMIFISLIAMGYISLVVNDQRQTTDNDLSASALAAAHGGIEEGKRILLYCRTLQINNPVTYASSGCDASLNSENNCDVFKTGQPYTLAHDTLGVPITSSGEGVTGDSEEYQQYFSCLTIQTKTPSASVTITKDHPYIQQLKTVAPFQQLEVSWTREGAYVLPSGLVSGWPTLSGWGNGVSPYMPVIALQVVPYSSLADLNTVEHDSKTVYIAPCNASVAGCTGPGVLTNINALDVRDTPGNTRLGTSPLTYAPCTVNGTTSYQCSVILTGFNGGNAGGTQYYVRAKVLYADQTTLQLAPRDSGGGSVKFDNIQPWLDATGRTNDVFRRVQAQVTYANQNLPLPQNALDSAAPICKQMLVTADPSTTTYNCN